MKLATPCRANKLDPVFMDLDIFLLLLFPVEIIFSERAMDRVNLMISLTIRTLERVEVWFFFFCFKLGRVQFFICLTTPSEFAMVLQFMGAITLDVF